MSRVFSYVIVFKNMIFSGYLIFQHHCINPTKSIIGSDLPEGTQPCLASHPRPFLKGGSFPLFPIPLYLQLWSSTCHSIKALYLQLTLLPMLLLPPPPKSVSPGTALAWD